VDVSYEFLGTLFQGAPMFRTFKDETALALIAVFDADGDWEAAEVDQIRYLHADGSPLCRSYHNSCSARRWRHVPRSLHFARHQSPSNHRFLGFGSASDPGKISSGCANSPKEILAKGEIHNGRRIRTTNRNNLHLA
jgi:hypothetical protein